MANIPGVGITNSGWSVPATTHVFEKPGGKLTTDDWTGRFEIEGNTRLIALAVLEYALRFEEAGADQVSFSKFVFNFDGKTIKIKPRLVGTDPEKVKEVTDLIEEIEKVIALKAFW